MYLAQRFTVCLAALGLMAAACNKNERTAPEAPLPVAASPAKKPAPTPPEPTPTAEVPAAGEAAPGASKVPFNEGKMVDEIDTKKVRLNDLLSTNKLVGSGSIADILDANVDGYSNKIAVAMAGTGTEFLKGHGAGGLGFQGTGTGGGGHGGYGRIHGMGKIDTDGDGLGVRAGLGKKKTKRTGKLKVGAGSSTGFCKKSNVKSVVRRRAGAIRACYEARLPLKPRLSGKLTAKWTIGADGSVRGVTAQGSLKDGKVKACVLRVLRRMRFQKPEGGICVVRWPFVFNPGG